MTLSWFFVLLAVKFVIGILDLRDGQKSSPLSRSRVSELPREQRGFYTWGGGQRWHTSCAKITLPSGCSLERGRAESKDTHPGERWWDGSQWSQKGELNLRQICLEPRGLGSGGWVEGGRMDWKRERWQWWCQACAWAIQCRLRTSLRRTILSEDWCWEEGWVCYVVHWRKGKLSQLVVGRITEIMFVQSWACSWYSIHAKCENVKGFQQRHGAEWRERGFCRQTDWGSNPWAAAVSLMWLWTLYFIHLRLGPSSGDLDG